jgi:Tfp pilus assembly protein PilO
MDGETLVMLEMTLTAVLCLGFGFYQLWSLNKDKKKALQEKQNLQKQTLRKQALAAEDAAPKP